jgi:TonB family protein
MTKCAIFHLRCLGNGLLMFAPAQTGGSRTQTRTLAVSLAAHAALFAWLIYSAGPKVLAPSAVRAGIANGSVTQLYWPAHVTSASAGDFQSSTEIPDEQVRKRLRWQQLVKKRKSQERAPAVAQNTADSQATAASTQTGGAAPAGLPYGSLGMGALTGDEIRPALPVTAHDPVVDPSDLPPAEGSVIVEVTIDDKGNIIDKKVIESLTPAIDAKVLTALENWRFQPATRNGVAIPSKQDVYYHFRPRG